MKKKLSPINIINKALNDLIINKPIIIEGVSFLEASRLIAEFKHFTYYLEFDETLEENKYEFYLRKR